ncbi:11-beta-hydroxysteroid dehydrogenase 1A-like isoform X2 [Nicotiana tabacum]|uniref:11-beta-hydroxysteroid dehydrogenase 1A-like isoform X2 n=2 Tax=Nicotiana tabacum TaxID=4097 RepID=A0AC58SPR9_TOBAC|nr:11-beta-hydroxysteroid dehydrogenase 1A-like isoform X2 [Nicotiana tomentosiformis]
MASNYYFFHTLTTLLISPLVLGTLCVIFPFFCIFRIVLFLYRLVVSENMKGKVVLITGASSGIGEELAYEYARRGSSIVIVARREEQLQKVAEKAMCLGSPDVLSIRADVSNVDDCKRLVDQTVNHFVDHLVNNAGITSLCSINDVTDITKFTSVMDINFWGSVYPTYFAIPHLKKTRGKVFVNSSSVAILHPPSLSFYTASKAALIGFYETMRLELAPEISITIATLGFTDSEITRGKHLKDGVLQVESELANNVVVLPVISSSDCAKSIVSAICRKKRYITEPKYFWVLFFAKTVCPRAFEWFNRTFMSKLCTGALQSQAKKA